MGNFEIDWKGFEEVLICGEECGDCCRGQQFCSESHSAEVERDKVLTLAYFNANENV